MRLKKFINPSNIPSQTYRINPAANTFEDPAGLEASPCIGYAYLQINRSEQTVFFENGTCKSPNASVGETATISGTTYTVVIIQLFKDK